MRKLESTNYRIRVLAVPPPQNKLGGTRLKFFIAPKNFCGFRPVHEKTRLKLCHLFWGGVQQVHEYGNVYPLYGVLRLWALLQKARKDPNLWTKPFLFCDWNQSTELEKERREKKSSKVNEQLAGLPARLRVYKKKTFLLSSSSFFFVVTFLIFLFLLSFGQNFPSFAQKSVSFLLKQFPRA